MLDCAIALIVSVSVSIDYLLLLVVFILPQRIVRVLESGEFLDLLVLFPEVFYNCKIGRFITFKGGKKTFEAVVALGRVCHVANTRPKNIYRYLNCKAKVESSLISASTGRQ